MTWLEERILSSCHTPQTIDGLHRLIGTRRELILEDCVRLVYAGHLTERDGMFRTEKR